MNVYVVITAVTVMILRDFRRYAFRIYMLDGWRSFAVKGL
jgi:hypothetical protein